MCFWHSPFDAGPSVLATTPINFFGHGKSGMSTGISDLDLRLADRTLLLPTTQRICHQSRPPERDRGGSSARFYRLTSPVEIHSRTAIGEARSRPNPRRYRGYPSEALAYNSCFRGRAVEIASGSVAVSGSIPTKHPRLKSGVTVHKCEKLCYRGSVSQIGQGINKYKVHGLILLHEYASD